MSDMLIDGVTKGAVSCARLAVGYESHALLVKEVVHRDVHRAESGHTAAEGVARHL